MQSMVVDFQKWFMDLNAGGCTKARCLSTQMKHNCNGYNHITQATCWPIERLKTCPSVPSSREIFYTFRQDGIMRHWIWTVIPLLFLHLLKGKTKGQSGMMPFTLLICENQEKRQLSTFSFILRNRKYCTFLGKYTGKCSVNQFLKLVYYLRK